MYRAAFLADERIARLSFLPAAVADHQGPDAKLFFALRAAVTPAGYERGNFDVSAFDEFDANTALVGDLDEIIRRWQLAVGGRQRISS